MTNETKDKDFDYYNHILQTAVVCTVLSRPCCEEAHVIQICADFMIKSAITKPRVHTKFSVNRFICYYRTPSASQIANFCDDVSCHVGTRLPHDIKTLILVHPCVSKKHWTTHRLLSVSTYSCAFLPAHANVLLILSYVSPILSRSSGPLLRSIRLPVQKTCSFSNRPLSIHKTGHNHPVPHRCL